MKIQKIIRFMFQGLENSPTNTEVALLASRDIIPLTNIHLKNSRIIANRVAMLHLLPKNGIVAELGVDQGLYSENIISITKPKKFYLIDIILSDRLRERLNKKRFENSIFIQSDSVKALDSMPNNYFDWIYIDTTHTYEQTKNELSIAKSKIVNKGYICGHDYILYSYVDKIRYGVTKAVNEFCVKNRWEIIYLTLETNGYYSYALRKL